MPEKKALQEGKYVFFILLLVAGILRFHQLESIPFFNDELSALSRLDFSSFSQLIEKGVKPDGHPAFTQVFLYLWTKLFGTSEMVVRFPFILAGMAAILIFYQLQLRLFGRTAANVLLAIMGAGQLLIFDTVMARPYAFGLLFTAMTAYTVWLFGEDEKAKRRQILILGFSLALSAYTHYFAALTAGLIYFIGFLPVRNRSIKAYLLSGLLAALLYLPHLSIFLTQISHGGIGGPEGWLSEPEILDFANFMLAGISFNQILFAAILTGIIYGFFKRRNKAFYFFLLLPVLVFAIGWFYSTFRNPVMHAQTFVFALPFIFMAAASVTKGRNRIISTFLPLVISGMLIWSLLYERNHYETMKAQPFAWAAKKSVDHPQAIKGFSINPEYVRFYHEDFEADSEMVEKLTDGKSDGYLSDGSDYTSDVIAGKLFPHIAERFDGFTFTGLHLTEGDDNRASFGRFLLNDSSSSSSKAEYLSLMEIDLGSEEWSFAHEIVAHVVFDTMPSPETHLVFDLSRDGENVHWSASKMIDSGVYFEGKYFLAWGIFLWDVFERKREMENAKLKIYLWNPAKVTMDVGYREVYRRNENPNRYGLLNPRP